MSDNVNTSSGWGGFFLTGMLWIFSSLTLADWAMVCTMFAGIATGTDKIYRWYKEKKNNKQ
jgi:hypothetical protein